MASWFGAENRGVVMAWWGTNYVLGGFLATAFATWSVSQQMLLPGLGWRRGFLFPALILLAITIGFFAWDEDTPEHEEAPSPGGVAARREPPDWRDLGVLLRTPGLWMIGSSYFFLEMCRYALMFWLPFYMVSQLHYRLQVAGYVSSLYELVGIAGAVLAGYLSDRFSQSRRAPVSAMMLCGLGIVMLLQSRMARTGLLGTAIAISLAGILSYGPDTLLSGAGAQDIGTERAAGTASGLIDGLGHLGSLLSPYVVVYVSRQYGWDRLFFIFAIAAFLAAAVLVPIWRMQPADWERVAREERAVAL
jgi:MFS transporter, OPA family, glycerol-3-phosphate transporter